MWWNVWVHPVLICNPQRYFELTLALSLWAYKLEIWKGCPQFCYVLYRMSTRNRYMTLNLPAILLVARRCGTVRASKSVCCLVSDSLVVQLVRRSEMCIHIIVYMKIKLLYVIFWIDTSVHLHIESPKRVDRAITRHKPPVVGRSDVWQCIATNLFLDKDSTQITADLALPTRSSSSLSDMKSMLTLVLQHARTGWVCMLCQSVNWTMQ